MKWKSSPSRYRNWTGRFSIDARGHLVPAWNERSTVCPRLMLRKRDPDLGGAAAHLDVVIVEDLPELAVEFDGDALLEFTGADHVAGTGLRVGRERAADPRADRVLASGFSGGLGSCAES